MFWKKKTVIVVTALSVLALALIILNKSTRPTQVLQLGAGLRPTCSGHNDCPGNWMYCSGGEC